MGWDEIKYSLNSTLGTANHRPLNTQIDELKTTVGATADAAGTATTGTVMGKLRNCIERLETIRTYTVTNNTASTTGTLSQKLTSAINNTATNNTANATGILSQKLSYIINTLIGATNNTGGSGDSGTVMAKLNALIKSVYKNSITIVSASTSNTSTTFSFSLTNVLVFYASIFTSSAQTSSGSSSRGYSYVYVAIDGSTETRYGGSENVGVFYLTINKTFVGIENIVDNLRAISSSSPFFFNSLSFRGTFYDGYRGASSSAYIYYVQM